MSKRIIGAELLDLKDKIFHCTKELSWELYELNFLFILAHLNLNMGYDYKIYKDYILYGKTGKYLIPLTDSLSEFYLKMIGELQGKTILLDVPNKYANHFTKMKRTYNASKRMWGEHDFVYETSHLRDLSGKRLRRIRGYLNGYKNDPNIEIVDILRDNHIKNKVQGVLDRWYYMKSNSGTTKPVRKKFIPYLMTIMDFLQEHLDLNFIGVYDHSKCDLIGVALSVKLSDGSWCNCFRHADHEYNNLADYMLHELSFRHDEPFEIDGAGDGRNSSLYKSKSKYLTDDVMDKQIYSYMVKTAR